MVRWLDMHAPLWSLSITLFLAFAKVIIGDMQRVAVTRPNIFKRQHPDIENLLGPDCVGLFLVIQGRSVQRQGGRTQWLKRSRAIISGSVGAD